MVSLTLLFQPSVFALTHSDEPLATSEAANLPDSKNTWLLIDNFESKQLANDWIKKDTKNDTQPRIENPQVSEIQQEANLSNRFLMKKPAAEGVVGNRKALTFKKLPTAIAVGDTYTIYSRVNIEYFPNNHVYGLSNLGPEGIAANDYNAFEPSLRITDKFESNGYKNNGTLMVKTHDGYARIFNPLTQKEAKPAAANTWYEIWLVVNNNTVANGGQKYDVYVRGGEFKQQAKVFSGANFRMERELPLTYFLMNCNTGPADKPYGNGGIRYDDLYMHPGTALDAPI